MMSEPEAAEHIVSNYSTKVYQQLAAQKSELPAQKLFDLALRGYIQLKASKQIPADHHILSVIDYTLSSTRKRMWVIDLSKPKVLYHTLVAHGRNSGEEYARSFSNIPESFQSSLGFYITGDTYQGKHGLSLYLDGAEPTVNDKARERAIVIHGASYVSEWFIQEHGRLGRSLGCPALPSSLSGNIIQTIADRTCVFAYYPDRQYITQSKLLNQSISLNDLGAIAEQPEDLLAYLPETQTEKISE